jgi:hypothetical protein
VVAQLAASQEGLSSVKLVMYMTLLYMFALHIWFSGVFHFDNSITFKNNYILRIFLFLSCLFIHYDDYITSMAFVMIRLSVAIFSSI